MISRSGNADLEDDLVLLRFFLPGMAASYSDAQLETEGTAFTTLNRFIALKMLEARELVQECITKGEQSAGYREFCGMAPGLALIADAAGYRLYVESLFDEFSTEIKVLFDRRDVASVLWPKRQTFEGLLTVLNARELAGVWGEDETIGWVYQFFNSGEERRKMRDERARRRGTAENWPYATSFSRRDMSCNFLQIILSAACGWRCMTEAGVSSSFASTLSAPLMSLLGPACGRIQETFGFSTPRAVRGISFSTASIFS
jgi:hypothetical protein